jgi:ribosome-associated translation inhibitor RaiA
MYSMFISAGLHSRLAATGTLHATGEGNDVAGSVRMAFAEVLAQLKKHMGKLRKDYEWKRKRTRRLPAPDGSLVS